MRGLGRALIETRQLSRKWPGEEPQGRLRNPSEASSRSSGGKRSKAKVRPAPVSASLGSPPGPPRSGGASQLPLLGHLSFHMVPGPTASQSLSCTTAGTTLYLPWYLQGDPDSPTEQSPSVRGKQHGTRKKEPVKTSQHMGEEETWIPRTLRVFIEIGGKDN